MAQPNGQGRAVIVSATVSVLAMAPFPLTPNSELGRLLALGLWWLPLLPMMRACQLLTKRRVQPDHAALTPAVRVWVALGSHLLLSPLLALGLLHAASESNLLAGAAEAGPSSVIAWGLWALASGASAIAVALVALGHGLVERQAKSAQAGVPEA